MEKPLLLRVGAAVAYGVCSILIVFVNKILLTNFRFPSFLCAGIGQMVSTVVILFVGSSLGVVSFPRMDRSIPRKIFPLPLIYALNLISGLGGTQKIKERKKRTVMKLKDDFSLPMFTVLRRFSILMTMVLESVILGVNASFAVRVSVGLMILGSIIAAVYDLTFDATGYLLIFINDICTAANGVYMKQKLEAKEMKLLTPRTPTLMKPFTHRFGSCTITRKNGVSVGLATCFFLSCICGFLLNYSVVLCTEYNSALTTTCIGPIKNLFVTYVGMFSSGDYVFQWTNFVGINVSVLGSILYTYVTFRSKDTKQRLITVRPKSPRDGDSRPLL